jgi:hypothetical protein
LRRESGGIPLRSSAGTPATINRGPIRLPDDAERAMLMRDGGFIPGRSRPPRWLTARAS